MINKLLRPARWLTFVLGFLISLMSVYSYISITPLVIRDPSVILPDPSWNYAVLSSALKGLGLPANFYALYTLGFTLIFSLSFLVCGWLILLRRSQDWFGMFLSLLLLIWSSGGGVFTSMPRPSWIEGAFLGWFMWPGLFLLLYLFPSGHIVPRWARWFAWIWVLFCVYGLTATILNVLSNFVSALPILFSVLLVGIYAQIYRYRHAGTLERQQIKIVVAALIFLAGSFILIALLINFTGLTDPARINPTGALVFYLFFSTVGVLAFVGVPVSIAIAVLRYRLWDVDIVIRRTLVYGALTLTLALVYFGSVILLQSLVTAIGGQQSAVITVISTLLIAALFTPLRRRIQNDIDRRFYRKKYDAEKTVAAFSAGLRQEVDLEQIGERLLSVVDETMQPESISLWMRKVKR